MKILELQIRPECREKNTDSDFLDKSWVYWPHFKCALPSRALFQNRYIHKMVRFLRVGHICSERNSEQV